MALTPGTRLGPYEVTAQIGEGGMGQVYRATDTRLKRQVAIKILPPSLAADHDRLARFQREAEVLASLNHPNIAGIYGLEESGGMTALVMELVEGDDLSQRLVRGAIPLDEALPIAKQIAEALEAAHEQGIIHRDLKPANIRIRPDGTVKVLDFGLAKALDPAGGRPDASESPTLTSPALTQAGVILGTAAYMSPEQARGKPAGKRADIWAFGCVLFEMLMGRRAFDGETLTDTLVAIMEREPDWAALPTLPSPIARLLRRCLEKDVRRRLHDMADVLIEVNDALSGAPTMIVEQNAPARNRPRALIGAFTVGVLVTGLAATFVGRFSGSRADGADLGPSFSRILRLTSGPARDWAPAISPDGKWVAYLSDARGPTDVWVTFIAGGEPANLTASAGLEVTPGTGIGGLEISPDGARIAVMARMRGMSSPFETWEIPAPLPGAPRKLLTDFVGMRWSPDSRMVTFVRAGGPAGDALWIANSDGTNRREIVKLRPGRHIHWPAWSRDGHIYFIDTRAPLLNMEPSGISRIKADGGNIEPIVVTSRRAIFPMPMPNGNGLIYAGNPTSAELGLWWRRSPGGLDRPLTSGVGEYAEPRISSDGRTLVCTLYDIHQSLIRVAVARNFGSTTSITNGYTGDLDPTLGPTADELVFSSSRAGMRHLWRARLDGSNARPLTSGPWFDERPSVSPDGQQIAFVSDRDNRRAIWLISSDGGAPRKLADAEVNWGLSWSRDGREMTFSGSVGDQSGLWVVSVADGRMRQIPTAGSDVVGDNAASPTRDLIAYIAATTSGRSETRLVFVDFFGHRAYETLPPPPNFKTGGFANGVLAWAPDGNRLAVVIQGTETPSVWIVEPDAALPYRQLIEFAGGPRIRGIAWSASGDAVIIGKHDVASSDIVLMDSGK